jgi:hypothetical protein
MKYLPLPSFVTFLFKRLKLLQLMKKLILLITLLLIVSQNIIAQCNVGSYTVVGNQTITGSCKITGDLTLPNGTTLNVDLTGATADTFVVRGNILLQGNAVLWIHSSSNSTNDQFIVSNNFSNHRNIVSKDSSRMVLEYIEFRTQEGNLANAASIYMNYSVENNSIFYIKESRLDREKAWLLCDIKNNATLIGFEPNGVPTEMYLQDAAQIVLHGPGTEVGVWLNFESITDTLNLTPNPTQPFTWKIGRGIGGLNTPWYLELDTVKTAPGVQIFPSSRVTVNGAGIPGAKELTVALMFANGTDTIKNLTVGMQNTTIPTGINGSITLNNVELGPIAWQLYALMNENLVVKNSIVNEIGIAGPSNLIVDSCLLQFAVLAAVGIGGSSLTINNTEIWNQSITAANNSSITLNNCSVNGSAFSTSDTLSDITVNGGCFFQNPIGCTQGTMLNWTTGQPYCNPFIPPGFPQNLTPLNVTFNGVNYSCSTGFAETISSDNATIFPNPFSNQISLSGSEKEPTSISIYNLVGQEILQKTFSNSISINTEQLNAGIYLFKLYNDNGGIKSGKIVKQ